MLDKIPGLLNYIPAVPIDELYCYSAVPEDKEVIGKLDQPGQGGYGLRTVRRSVLQNKLVEFAENLGVEIKRGHQLENLHQNEDSVTVTFANGVQETFSFVIGCDGLHSNTRQCLFGSVPADYTGQSQAGLTYAASCIPLTIIFLTDRRLCPKACQSEREKHRYERLRQWRSFSCGTDIGGHRWVGVCVSYHRSDRWPQSLLLPRITQFEPEAKETWKNMDAAAVAEFKKTSPVADWDYDAGNMLKSGYDIVKVGEHVVTQCCQIDSY